MKKSKNKVSVYMITDTSCDGCVFVEDHSNKKIPFQPDNLMAEEDPDLALSIFKATVRKSLPKHIKVFEYQA